MVNVCLSISGKFDGARGFWVGEVDAVTEVLLEDNITQAVQKELAMEKLSKLDVREALLKWSFKRKLTDNVTLPMCWWFNHFLKPV